VGVALRALRRLGGISHRAADLERGAARAAAEVVPGHVRIINFLLTGSQLADLRLSCWTRNSPCNKERPCNSKPLRQRSPHPQGGCPMVRRRALVFLTAALVLGSGRAVAVAAGAEAETRPTAAVSLGDSAASGEGARNYEPGTNQSGNFCHRSRDSYIHNTA